MIGPGANVAVDGISLPSNRPTPEDKPSLSSRIRATCERRNVPQRTSFARGFSKSVRGAHSPAIRHFPRTGTLACSFGCVLGSCTAPTSSPAGALHGQSCGGDSRYPDYQNRRCAFSSPDRLRLVGPPLCAIPRTVGAGFTNDPNPRLGSSPRGRRERGVCAALLPFGCPWVNESNRPQAALHYGVN